MGPVPSGAVACVDFVSFCLLASVFSLLSPGPVRPAPPDCERAIWPVRAALAARYVVELALSYSNPAGLTARALVFVTVHHLCSVVLLAAGAFTRSHSQTDVLPLALHFAQQLLPASSLVNGVYVASYLYLVAWLLQPGAFAAWCAYAGRSPVLLTLLVVALHFANLLFGNK